MFPMKKQCDEVMTDRNKQGMKIQDVCSAWLITACAVLMETLNLHTPGEFPKWEQSLQAQQHQSAFRVGKPILESSDPACFNSVSLLMEILVLAHFKYSSLLFIKDFFFSPVSKAQKSQKFGY